MASFRGLQQRNCSAPPTAANDDALPLCSAAYLSHPVRPGYFNLSASRSISNSYPCSSICCGFSSTKGNNSRYRNTATISFLLTRLALLFGVFLYISGDNSIGVVTVVATVVVSSDPSNIPVQSTAFVPSRNCKNGSNLVHWQIINYHKSGYELTQHMVWSVLNYCGLDCAEGKSSTMNVGYMHKPDILTIHNPFPAQLRWNQSDPLYLYYGSNTKSRFVHMVRDPYEMVISAYLYHSNAVPDPREDMLVAKTYNPCAVQNFLVDTFSEAYSEALMMEVDVMQRLITRAVGLCHNIRTRFYHVRYYHMLRRARNGTDVYEGVRLEAVRTLLHQIMPMTTNAIREAKNNKASPGLSLRMSLKDFPIGDEATFNKSAFKLYRHLMPEVEEVELDDKEQEEDEEVAAQRKDENNNNNNDNNNHNKKKKKAIVKERILPFYHCIGVHRAVDEFYKNGYLAAPNLTKHVTVDDMPLSERQELINRLREDRILAPLLDLSANLLLHKL